MREYAVKCTPELDLPTNNSRVTFLTIRVGTLVDIGVSHIWSLWIANPLLFVLHSLGRSSWWRYIRDLHVAKMMSGVASPRGKVNRNLILWHRSMIRVSKMPVTPSSRYVMEQHQEQR